MSPFLTDEIFWMWAIAIIAVITSGFFAHFAPKESPPWLYIHRLIIGIWTLGPPIFYLVDAQRRLMNDTPPTEVQKYFLDAATKFWAAVLVFLAGIYTSARWLK